MNDLIWIKVGPGVYHSRWEPFVTKRKYIVTRLRYRGLWATIAVTRRGKMSLCVLSDNMTAARMKAQESEEALRTLFA